MDLVVVEIHESRFADIAERRAETTFFQQELGVADMTRPFAHGHLGGAQAVESIHGRRNDRGMGIDRRRGRVFDKVGLEENGLPPDGRRKQLEAIPDNLNSLVVGVASKHRYT